VVAALTADFYGTLVEEDGPVISRIAAAIAADSPRRPAPDAVSRFWSRAFSSGCAAAHGPSFRSQRLIELESLRATVREFRAALDPESLSAELYAYWRTPRVLPGAEEFLTSIDLPLCIVSNIDTDDLEAAFASLGWSFPRVVTSESVRAYKPRREPFDAALHMLGSAPHETLHVGDSLGSDLAGAAALGMPCAWVNASSRPRPSGPAPAYVVSDLRQLLQTR